MWHKEIFKQQSKIIIHGYIINILYNTSEFFKYIDLPTNIFSQRYIDTELECPSATANIDFITLYASLALCLLLLFVLWSNALLIIVLFFTFFNCMHRLQYCALFKYICKILKCEWYCCSSCCIVVDIGMLIVVLIMACKSS